MKSIKIKVQEVHVGSDMCTDGAPNISRVGVEFTLSRVRKGHFSEALVVNISGAPITLKHDLHLGQCLVYDKQVISDSEEFPTAYVSATGSQKEDSSNQQSSFLESYIKVADFTEMKPTLLQVLEQGFLTGGIHTPWGYGNQRLGVWDSISGYR